MKKIFIIGEAGVNHNGDLNLAFKLCDAAREAGVDAVKFQTFKTEKFVTPAAELAAYQKETINTSKTQFDMIKELELSYEDFIKIKNYCDKIGIEFLSTADEEESLDFLLSLGIETMKVSSCDITNLPYLKKIGSLKKNIILSSGMADIGEIEDAVDILVNAGTEKENITILHCNSEYPTPYEDTNLYAMCTIRDAFKMKVGYSDHTLGIEIPIAVAALGATVIEKHFTIDKNLKGPDHSASLDPHELEAMVKAIRNVEKALGSGIKKPSHSELRNKPVMRKSIVAARNIQKGEKLSETNLMVKRSGIGISPMEWDKIIGKIARRAFKEDELIEE